MIAKPKEKLNNKRYGVIPLMAIGLPFLVAGLLLASGLNWTKPSVAEDLTGGPHVTTTSHRSCRAPLPNWRKN